MENASSFLPNLKCQKTMRSGFKYFLGMFILTICLPILSVAQGGGIPPAVADVPIDGGLSLLLAAGVGYGVKKYRQQRKK